MSSYQNHKKTLWFCRLTKGADEDMLPPSGHRLEYKLEKDVHQVYRGIQRMLSAYKDEKRGPTYIAVQSPLGMINRLVSMEIRVAFVCEGCDKEI